PNGNGLITFADLQNPDVGRFFSLGASGGVTGTFPLSAALPGFEVLGTGTLVVRADHPFSPAAADVSLSLGLTPALRTPLLDVLTPLNGAGDRVRTLPALDAVLPLIGKSLNEVFLQGDAPRVGDFLRPRDPAANYLSGG